MSSNECSKLPEKDKPFILALVSSGITILNIILAMVGAYIGNSSMTDSGVELLKFTFPLTMSAWTYYFGKQD